MSCTGTIQAYIDLSNYAQWPAIRAANAALAERYGTPLKPQAFGVGRLLEGESTRYCFTIFDAPMALCVGQKVFFDVATSDEGVKYATNIARAIGMPSFSNGRFTGYSYLPWTQARQDAVSAAKKNWEAGTTRKWPVPS